MFKATYNITRHYVCTISRKLKQTLIDNLLPNLIPIGPLLSGRLKCDQLTDHAGCKMMSIIDTIFV
jgi:hypothetical protein